MPATSAELDSANNLSHECDQLRRRNRFLETIVESLPVPLMVRDAAEERCLLYNAASVAFTGVRREQVIGKTLDEIHGTAKAARLHLADQHVISAHGRMITDTDLVNTPNGQRHVLKRRLPLFNENGEVEHILNLIEDVTELKRHAAELADMRTFLNLVIENMPAAIMVREQPSMRTVLLNRAAEQLTGYSRNAIIGKLPEDFLPPAAAASLRKRDTDIGVTKAPQFFDEHPLPSPNIERTVITHRHPVLGEDGELRYVVALMIDVTERSRQTRELKTVKTFLDTVIDNTPAPIMVRDPRDGRYILVNRAAERLLGRTSDDIIGKQLEDFYSSDEAAVIRTSDRQMLATKTPHMVQEHPIQFPGGSRIVTANRLPIVGDNGEVDYLLTMINDVTERHIQTRELEETKTFLDAVIENVPVGISVKDAVERRLILMNRAACELHGRPRDEMIGLTAKDALPAEIADMIEREDQELISSRKPIVIPNRVLDLAGRGQRTIATTRVPVLNRDGDVRYLMTVIEDLTEHQAAEERIAHLAHHDTLTDLPNRGAFARHFSETLDAARKTDSSVAIMCMDLDRFKEINDVFGIGVGDLLLRRVSTALREAAGGAFVARLDGDEFSLVSSNDVSPQATDRLAERLMTAINRDFEIDGRMLRVGLSVGIAIFPNDGDDATALISNADAALYRAKADGGGVVRFFEPGMDKKLRDQRALNHELRSAIQNGDISIFYQPQAQIDGTIVGFEALARWQHPIRGFVSPGIFIPLAEESGLILELGERILRTACREAASWPKPLHVAVNVSALQFRHGDLPTLVHSILMETGLPASRLELEVTESVLIDDMTRAISILRRLKLLGVRIAMDDFGTGYSSLSNLQAFPLDKIKIDRSFIMNLDSNQQSATIVRAIIGLGRGLALPVMAEGVETAAQLKFLANEACAGVQGYWIGKPRPIEDYAETVGRRPTGRLARDVA